MIEELQPRDIKQAVGVYVRGTEEEDPPGRVTPDRAEEVLRRAQCFVYKSDGIIEGLLTFSASNSRDATIDFICSLKHRKGVGSELMKYLAKHSEKIGIERIYSTVSTRDERAMAFYKRCGFKKYGERMEEDNGQDFLLDKVRATPAEIIGSLTTSRPNSSANAPF